MVADTDVAATVERPPRNSVGPIAWIRTNLLSSWSNALLTVIGLYLAYEVASSLIHWGLLSATFTGADGSACTREGAGACWPFITAKFAQFMYGRYPEPERWRVDLAGGILVVSILLLFWKGLPHRRLLAVAALIVLPPLGIWLLAGGLGLPYVETREWGGLMLTIFISLYAGLIAIPLGILLALGRRSELPVIKMLSIIFIEFWRGVPIVAVIFLASILLPLIMPSGVGVDRLARAVIGLGLVIAAYMAEAVRGGLQAIPEGQHEAATALGLGYWRTTGFIILPQALRITIGQREQMDEVASALRELAEAAR